MGPVTGVRIVNLRVREKVAYPDLTVDLAGRHAKHLVVGLENGGGKSTLLGALYHVFVPAADQFLPRRAQRRQQKKGELKRLEQYIPGGDPTHFIIELEALSKNGVLPTLDAPRLLVGACLWKPRGSKSSDKPIEFFWSVQSVAPQVSLRDIPLRGPGGRLLDHREFEAWLKQLRVDLPSAQVNIEEYQGPWEQHLRNLGIDVEYVRQFLLRMNEDEGAADQVFTYASSRAFLNSLVEVVGDPTAIDQLKRGLADAAADAAKMTLDRQRAALFATLVEHTRPLVDEVAALKKREAERDHLLDQVISIQVRLNERLQDGFRAASEAAEARDDADRAFADARQVYDDALARHMLARVQLGRVQADAAAARVEAAETERDGLRREERLLRAAAFLADRRTIEARIRDIELVLTRKAVEAEPLRRALSSAVQALGIRVANDLERLHAELQSHSDAASAADRDLVVAVDAQTAAATTAGAAEAERSVLERERETHEGQIESAVKAAVLPDRMADPEAERHRVEHRAAEEMATAEAREVDRERAVAALSQLAAQDGKLAAEGGAADERVRRAETELAKATERTDVLARRISESGFVDLSPVVLADHAEGIVGRLSEAGEAARLKQASAAVGAASAKRAAMWLRDQERLPPRPDVEAFCDLARTRRLGARPGWSYLSALQPDVAVRCAERQPGLADGIVVNVPEDLSAVVDLVTAQRDTLHAPVIIGPPSAFEDARGAVEDDCTVVLPHSAHWSVAAGRLVTEDKTTEADRWTKEYDDAVERAEAAMRLRDAVESWNDDIGPQGIAVRDQTLRLSMTTRDEISSERRRIGSEAAAKTTERDRSERDRDTARARHQDHLARARRLEALVPIRARLSGIGRRLEALQEDAVKARAAREEAADAIKVAGRRRDDATVAAQRISSHIGELRAEQRRASAIAAVTVRAEDAIEPADAGADREQLARLVADRDERWRGAISDPELRTQLDTQRSRVEEVDKALGDYQDVVGDAADRLTEEAAKAADDYRRAAEDLRRGVERLVEQIGALTTTARQLKQDLDRVVADYDGLRRSATLSAAETTSVTEMAEVIASRLLKERDDARVARADREREQGVAVSLERAMAERVDLLESALQRLGAALRPLAAGGDLLPSVDLAADRPPSSVDNTAASSLAAFLRVLVDVTGRVISGDNLDQRGDKGATLRALGDLDAAVHDLRHSVDEIEARAGRSLDDAERLLRAVPDDVARGDRVIQVLRGALRPQLAALAVGHHTDIVQRLAAVKHHVDTFDARISSLADTVHATVGGLLREIRRTVRESQLPSTPAMGRWAGAELLHLSGLDALTKDERRVAIGATLKAWFSPESQEVRRQFDGNDVVNELLEAVTPQFVARILIPSDPLDPEHKPVDHLALETSGGEGVTVALILASLLASRRASARGHRRTTLLLDNPFAKVTKPEFLRLARDVADELSVQLVAFTGIRDIAALTVFPRLTQLRVSRRVNANFVVPYAIDDEHLQPLIRNGTLYVSPVEWEAAQRPEATDTWPQMSAVSIETKGESS